MYNILNDIRVLDLSRYISGPSCCRILADMGAEVIKVEKAGEGDVGRQCGPMKNGSSLYFSAYNRNKKSVTIDFRSEKGKEVLRRLIQVSDVVVENFKAGTMAAMGFGYDTIAQINPRAILVSITGFGQEGPDAKRPAYDQVISYRAHLYRKLGEGDFQLGPELMSDTIMGMNAATATLLALYDRMKTGKGQWVDCCMLTSSVGSWPLAMADYAMNGERRQDLNSIDAPNGIFQTKDGGWVILYAGAQSMFLRVRDIINDPVLNEEQYLDGNIRLRDCAILLERIRAWAKTKDQDEIDQIMAKVGVACGKISTWDDVLKDKQLAYRKDIIQLPVKNCGTVPYTKFPACFSGQEYIEDSAAPDLGADNVEVLTTLLGMSPEEIAEYTC